MGFWRDVKVRLGLEEDWDDEYYDEDEEYDDEAADAGSDWGRESAAPPARSSASSSVRRVARSAAYDRAETSQAAPLRSVPTGPASVTRITPQVTVHIAEPRSFADVEAIAEKFRTGTPVIMNLNSAKPDLARRLMDFASGLTYGLEGGIQKVSEKVFMLTPHNVQVSDAERRRMRDRGFFLE